MTLIYLIAAAILTGVGGAVAAKLAAIRSWRQPIETCTADESAYGTQEHHKGRGLNQLPDSRRRFAVVAHPASTSIVTLINVGLFLPSRIGYATAEHIRRVDAQGLSALHRWSFTITRK